MVKLGNLFKLTKANINNNYCVITISNSFHLELLVKYLSNHLAQLLFFEIECSQKLYKFKGEFKSLILFSLSIMLQINYIIINELVMLDYHTSYHISTR